MSYLILQDFKKLIQTDNLSAIIGADYSLLDQAIAAAQSKVVSYLIQKYDTSQEFTDTLPWNITTPYKAQQRVYLDALAYNPTLTYNPGDLVLNAGSVYICVTGQTGAFDVANWLLLGTQYSMFYVTLPFPLFDIKGIYKPGNQIWWRGKNYTNLIGTAFQSHGGNLQYENYSSIPPINIYPDDAVAGLRNWGAGSAYSIPAGTVPTDTSMWTNRDSRNAEMVNNVIDCALYIIHSRIAPRNIPELRVKRYDDVIRWLKDAAKSEYITADLPLRAPKSGARIRWGSDIKRSNTY